MAENLEKFWMVWGLHSGMPRYRHATKESAQTEAKRLASQAPGEAFVVLAAVDAYVSPRLPAEQIKLVKAGGALKHIDADIPF